MEAVLREKFIVLSPILNERTRRLSAASEAKAIGRGGQSLLAQVTGLSCSTIYLGLQELAADEAVLFAGRVRQPGGGRKTLLHHQPKLLTALDELVEPMSRGAPQSPLRWNCKNVRKLATELQQQGYEIGRQ